MVRNSWRQGMEGGAKAHYDGIVALSQTDFSEDLRKITVVVMYGDNRQIRPLRRSGPADGKAGAEGYAQNVPRLPARRADD
jgi:non-heme chloroperoxidase